MAQPCTQQPTQPRTHRYLFPFQAPFPDLPPQKSGPLDQLAVLMMVHLPPSDLQHVFALYLGYILDPLIPLLGPFPHLARWTFVELGWSHSSWGPNIQSG